MKKLLAIATLAISTLVASAPAHADASAMAMQLVSGILSKAMHSGQQHRQPQCQPPSFPMNGRCAHRVTRGVASNQMRRGFYPATYLPPNIPGSPGYTGSVVNTTVSTGSIAHVERTQGAAPQGQRAEHKLASSKRRCVYKGPNAAPLDAQGFNAWCG
jgi:hypothetical protein